MDHGVQRVIPLTVTTAFVEHRWSGPAELGESKGPGGGQALHSALWAMDEIGFFSAGFSFPPSTVLPLLCLHL